MYFVDRKLLEDRLEYMEKLLETFSHQKEWNSEVEKLALERMVHMTIEVMIDVGNQLIDGFIMRDPGSYDDVIDILVDEKVISEENGKSLKEVIALRKLLLQEYTAIDIEKLVMTIENQSDTLLKLPGKIRMYLQNELGPVSAFLPHKD
ncbi:DUF86 domain-containing protein [Evansella sp. AB-P1]|uniref:DUF86 domain-containing protein n=1 Tax=Evansella sp. AB-P1 TaxID=3037653 RepID=UPI00241C4EC8|nr:DUF86 domain-containing protein [Evansella sp. AB-P1]MDG5788902.1 DUF86 domain-containing protein [Evansella sp. AB-P1]